jgi:hypothetical protein
MLALIMTALSVGAAFSEDAPERIVERAATARGVWKGDGDVAVRTTGRTAERNSDAAVLLIDFTRTTLPPDRFRIEEAWTERGREVRLVVVYDGKRGWESFGGMARECTPEELATLRAGEARGRLDALRGLTDAKKYTLRPLPDAQVEGEPCAGVRVSEGGQPAIDMYFSKKTHLLQRTAGKLPGPDGKLHDFSEVLSDYKDFEGRKFATKTVLQVGTFLNRETTLEKVEYIPAADTAKLFSKP